MKLDYSVTSILQAHNNHRGTNINIIKDFVASGAPLAKLIQDSDHPARYPSSALNGVVRKLAVKVAIVKRGKDIYLMRTDL
jgi:hypothetical protein